MNYRFIALALLPLTLTFASCLATAAPQTDTERLTAPVNNYCAAPGACQSNQAPAVAPLTPRLAASVSVLPDSPPVPRFDWKEAGQIILDGVNAARADARTCGERSFPPAPPLRWNDTLGAAALAHTENMAAQRYFSHIDPDGKRVGDRASQAGYLWTRIGENIAAGQLSPQEVIEGWLTSPGHCANIMNPAYTEMGAADSVTQDQQPQVIYWAQVLGKPCG